MTRKIILILLSLFLSSCAETFAVSAASTAYLIQKESIKDTISDTKITAQIFSKLKLSSYGDVHINVSSGRVLLSGYVKDKHGLKQIKKHIWEIKGVKEVMSEVHIGKVKRNIVKDSLLASRIKSKLIFAKEMSSLEINVEVYGGEAYLLGNLASRSEIKRAAKIAAKVYGVKKVISYLRVS